MNSNPDRDTVTWREVADQLEPDEVRYLDEAERRSAFPGVIRQFLINQAQYFAEQNLTHHFHFGHLAKPLGAQRVWPCTEFIEPGSWSRQFRGTVRDVSECCRVTAAGMQYTSGQVDRYVLISAGDPYDYEEWGDVFVDTEDARLLAVALIETADEVDRLALAAELQFPAGETG